MRKRLLLRFSAVWPAPPGRGAAVDRRPGVQMLSPPWPCPDRRERSIRVYLPPSYDTSKRRYPVLYMHDGQNLFDDATAFVGEWGVDEPWTRWRNEGLEVIVVGIDHGRDKRIAN